MTVADFNWHEHLPDRVTREQGEHSRSRAPWHGHISPHFSHEADSDTSRNAPISTATNDNLWPDTTVVRDKPIPA